MQEPSHIHSTTLFENLLLQVSDLYEKYAPDEVKHRRNTHLLKQPDAVILTCYLYGILHSCTTLIGIYRLCRTIYGKNFPSRTRFIRKCNNLQQTLSFINQSFMKKSEPDRIVRSTGRKWCNIKIFFRY
jgi:hypothetical protein